MGSFSVDLSSIRLISVADLETMELGTAIQLVQGQRAALLEDQLKDQLKEVQDRNRKVDELNSTLSSARELMAQFGPEDKTGKTIEDLIKDQNKSLRDDVSSDWSRANILHKKATYREIEDTIFEKRHDILKAKSNQDEIKKNDKKNYKDNPEWQAQETIIIQAKRDLEKAEKAERTKIPDIEFRVDHTKAGAILLDLRAAAAKAGTKLDIGDKGQLQALVENIKSQIDTLSNTQQLDMLRLQNYSTKYNETFEARTNMLKQAHELNTKILNNTRGT